MNGHIYEQWFGFAKTTFIDIAAWNGFLDKLAKISESSQYMFYATQLGIETILRSRFSCQ